MCYTKRYDYHIFLYYISFGQQKKINFLFVLAWQLNLMVRLIIKCGNDVLENGEECDGTSMGKHTCQSINKDLP